MHSKYIALHNCILIQTEIFIARQYTLYILQTNNQIS